MLAQIGAGGMGEVWKARDTRLDRIVAIKVAKEQFSESFEREAHAIASLNHPHICQLYDVGALPSGAGYLVMEYVEGAPVISSARPGPLPFDVALKLGIQIADALSAAHNKGIVHRDLKPANILVTKSGSVKILDFGLATVSRPGPVHAHANLPPEQIPTEEMWEAGAVVGTLQYASPEQLQGKPTDARSDIFSFGLVLYEMLTGRHAYQADNAASLIAAVLQGPPLAVMSVTPPALSRILNRCLATDPEERWQSAQDLQANLEWVSLGLHEIVPPKPAAISRKWWIIAAAAIVVAVVAGAVVMAWLRPAAVERTVKLSVLPPEGATFVSGAIAGPPAISPDGRMLAFVADQSGQQRLWVRTLDSLTARAIPDTDGARSPFWSPDSGSIGFFTQDRLKKVDLNGGAVQALANVPGGFSASGVWGPGDKILYAPSNLLNLFLIPASGGQPSPATRLEAGDIGHFWPAFLPDGQHFIYGTQAGAHVFAGTLGSFDRAGLLNNAIHAVYIPASGSWPEYLLYVRDNTLTAQPFDSSARAVRGEPHTIAERVIPFDFSASAQGSLAFRSETTGGQELITFDRNGNRLASLGKQSGPPGAMRFSPDGKMVAVVQSSGRSQDIWLHDLARGVTSRFTFNGGNNPVWSPDGATILFRKMGGLYTKASNGTGAEEPIYTDQEDPALRNATDWSNDGHSLLIARTEPKTGFDMWLLLDPLQKGPHKALPLLQSPVNEGQGRFSTNPGPPRWVAYSSEESGVNEIYVMTMPGASPGKWQISNGGGYAPRWGRDGRELYYVGPDLRTVMAVEVEPGPRFRPGQPHARFKFPAQVNAVTNDSGFAVSPDGKTFLVEVPGQESTTSGINVVLNWQNDLPK
jgi:Tol biopolymer transport system component